MLSFYKILVYHLGVLSVSHVVLHHLALVVVGKTDVLNVAHVLVCEYAQSVNANIMKMN